MKSRYFFRIVLFILIVIYFINFLRIDYLIKETIIEVRNFINDLKIYFIGQPLNDPLIRPWSVIGKNI